MTVSHEAGSAGLKWELDLWGRIRRSIEAARAQLLSKQENQRAVILSLVSNVAEAYFDLRALDLQVDITRRTLKAWEDPVFCRERLGLDEPLGSIDRKKLNVNGGSLAAGHPFAATGGRIVAALAKALHERGEGRGAISICAAGGQGVVAILEAA